VSESEQGTDSARDAFVRWVREQHDQMASYAARRELIGDAAEGVPVWSIPHQVFLGRFYDKATPTGGYWYVAGGVPSDHIEAHLAGDARQALRHFSMKWQLQAAQIEEGSSTEQGDHPPDFANVAHNLSRSAEVLMACADNDDYWKKNDQGPSESAPT
jgi:hypothetical protein